MRNKESQKALMSCRCSPGGKQNNEKVWGKKRYRTDNYLIRSEQVLIDRQENKPE